MGRSKDNTVDAFTGCFTALAMTLPEMALDQESLLGVTLKRDDIAIGNTINKRMIKQIHIP